MNVTEQSTRTTRWDTARSVGLTFKVLDRTLKSEGIDAVRKIMDNCWFDEEHCSK